MEFSQVSDILDSFANDLDTKKTNGRLIRIDLDFNAKTVLIKKGFFSYLR